MKAYWHKIKDFFHRKPYEAGGIILGVLALLYYFLSSSSATDATITPQDDGTLTGSPIYTTGDSGSATVDTSALQSIQDQLTNSQNVNDYLQQEIQQQALANQQTISSMQASQSSNPLQQMMTMQMEQSLFSTVSAGAKNIFNNIFGTGTKTASTASTGILPDSIPPTYESSMAPGTLNYQALDAAAGTPSFMEASNASFIVIVLLLNIIFSSCIVSPIYT